MTFDGLYFTENIIGIIGLLQNPEISEEYIDGLSQAIDMLILGEDLPEDDCWELAKTLTDLRRLLKQLGDKG